MIYWLVLGYAFCCIATYRLALKMESMESIFGLCLLSPLVIFVALATAFGNWIYNRIAE